MAHKDWTEQEVRLIVADHFKMLEAELLGEPYKKSPPEKTLAPAITSKPWLSRKARTIDFAERVGHAGHWRWLLGRRGDMPSPKAACGRNHGMSLVVEA